MIRRIVLIAWFCCLAVTFYGQTTADSIAIVSADWETVVTSNNIVHKRASIPQLYKGCQSINLIEIPRDKKLHYGVAVSEMKKMSLHAEENQALAAINGSFYDMGKGNSVCFLKVGKEVVDTTTTQEFALRVTGAVYTHKNKLKVLPWNSDIESNYRKTKGTVLASGPLLMHNGNICSWDMCDSSFIVTKHPRSAIFTTKDKRTVFITVDGRSKGNAVGVSIPELTHLIRILGGKDALNLDGGGSTTLWMKGAPENGIVNYPSDNGKFDHYGERKIPNIIYVY
ncbi:MAG: phosphodiester glycosidase family protein [Bacteroidaceae bacterium]|nr:phosphodiester glycosidase family protein [Bacteroidaceae bacterium]